MRKSKEKATLVVFFISLSLRKIFSELKKMVMKFVLTLLIWTMMPFTFWKCSSETGSHERFLMWWPTVSSQ